MQFLSKLRQTSLIQMLETVIMVRLLCPVVLCEEKIGVFLFEKYLKSTPKITKNPNFSIFQSFYAILVKLWTDFVDWNVLKGQKGQQGNNCLSNSLL